MHVLMRIAKVLEASIAEVFLEKGTRSRNWKGQGGLKERVKRRVAMTIRWAEMVDELNDEIWRCTQALCSERGTLGACVGVLHGGSVGLLHKG